MKNEKAQDRILQLIKTEGAKTAVELGKTLSITSMGARQHLERMEEAGLLTSEEAKLGVGRPKKLWHLAEKAQSHFPDRHDQLTVEMLISIKDVFGETGLDQLIEHRSRATARQYHEAVDAHTDLEGKVQALVEVRSAEGYMAAIRLQMKVLFFSKITALFAQQLTLARGFVVRSWKCFRVYSKGEPELNALSIFSKALVAVLIRSFLFLESTDHAQTEGNNVDAEDRCHPVSHIQAQKQPAIFATEA